MRLADTVDAIGLAAKIADLKEDIEAAKDDLERVSFEKELEWMLALEDIVAA